MSAYRGWHLSGLVQAQSGRPVTVTQGSDISGTGIGQDRGTFNGNNPYASGACATAAPCQLWLNVSAFNVDFLDDEGTVNNFSTVSNGSFATLRTAKDPRVGQIALKFIF